MTIAVTIDELRERYGRRTWRHGILALAFEVIAPTERFAINACRRVRFRMRGECCHRCGFFGPLSQLTRTRLTDGSTVPTCIDCDNLVIAAHALLSGDETSTLASLAWWRAGHTDCAKSRTGPTS